MNNIIVRTFIGLSDQEKQTELKKQISDNYNMIYYFSPYVETTKETSIEYINYKDSTSFEMFYRLMQNIDTKSIIILDECLVHKERTKIEYNTFREYSQKCGKLLIFNKLPIIESEKDLLILQDLTTPFRYREEKFIGLEGKLQVKKHRYMLTFTTINVKDDSKYQEKKTKIINENEETPAIIPRKLQVETTRYKPKNKKAILRRKGKNNLSYNDTNSDFETIYEFPLNFRVWNEFLYKTNVKSILFTVTDLGVDQYYKEMYENWIKELNNAYTNISTR